MDHCKRRFFAFSRWFLKMMVSSLNPKIVRRGRRGQQSLFFYLGSLSWKKWGEELSFCFLRGRLQGKKLPIKFVDRNHPKRNFHSVSQFVFVFIWVFYPTFKNFAQRLQRRKICFFVFLFKIAFMGKSSVKLEGTDDAKRHFYPVSQLFDLKFGSFTSRPNIVRMGCRKWKTVFCFF